MGDRSGFSFCRLAYEGATREPGGQGWSTDYPGADSNFMFRMEELTTIGMSKYPSGEFAYSILLATNPDLFRCPFLFASDVGTMRLSDEEVVGLRDYLEIGWLPVGGRFLGGGCVGPLVTCDQSSSPQQGIRRAHA